MSTPTVIASGNQLAVLDTEHTLGGAPFSLAGVYTLFVDRSVLQADDEIELRAYRTLAGTPLRLVYGPSIFRGVQGDAGEPGDQAQGEVVAISLPLQIPAGEAGAFTLTQTDGTGRTFPFSIEAV